MNRIVEYFYIHSFPLYTLKVYSTFQPEVFSKIHLVLSYCFLQTILCFIFFTVLLFNMTCFTIYPGLSSYPSSFYPNFLWYLLQIILFLPKIIDQNCSIIMTSFSLVKVFFHNISKRFNLDFLTRGAQ